MGGKAYQTDVNGNSVEVGMTEKKSSTKIEPSVDLLYNTTDNEFRVNGRVRAFNNKGMAEIGLSNMGDDTTFDLNAGRFISSKWLVRGGILKVNWVLGWIITSVVLCPYQPRYMTLIIVNIVFVVIYVLHKDTYGVIQMTRPFSSTNGGTYFGIKQVF